MKNKDKIPTSHIKEKKNFLLLVIMAGLIITSCKDQLTDVTEIDTSSYQTNTISKIDGNPILEMDSQTFYEGDYFEKFRNGLAKSYSREIISELNASARKAKNQNDGFVDAGPVLLNTAFRASKSKSAENFSTHFILKDTDGFEEEFVMATRRYIPSPVEDTAKAAEAGSEELDPEQTWLALNVDRFYLQDDDQGNELWPVTFTAVSMANPDNEIEITFDQDGLVSTSLHDQKGKSNNQDPEDFNLVFVEPVPASMDLPPPGDGDDDTGGGGGGGDSGRINDWTRGEPTGTYGAYDTYFGLKTIRLGWTGDGDGDAELQMFVKNNDNYNYNFPVSYKYRFDKVVRKHPINGGYSNHSVIEGADKGGSKNIYYGVPDVNKIGVDYHFDGRKGYQKIFGTYEKFDNEYFPLFNLSQHPGSWRVVLSDDDKDYADFSQRRRSEHADYIQTYHLNDGIWRSVYTGFTVREKSTGSSDDPIRESGARRITTSNAQSRADHNGNITASKSYDNGARLFKYRFTLSGSNI